MADRQFSRTLRPSSCFFQFPDEIFRSAACSPDHVLGSAKRFVYILRSVRDPKRRYIGLTADLVVRVTAHNAGQNPSTASWRPWVIDVSIEFRREKTAARFEKYLKSGSGHEFSRRHFEDEG